MSSISRRNLLLGLATLPAIPWPGIAAEGVWPSKLITYIVPYPAGGVTDILARLIVAELTPRLGATIVVENKSGASGAIGGTAVARAAPDGYTLLGTTTGPQTIIPHLNPKLNYDPIKSYEPVILIGSIPNVLIVGSASPFKTVADLIAAAKTQPGHLTFSSGGHGTLPHVTGELLKMLAGIDMLHVPHKGDAPSIQSVVGGHVNMAFVPIAPALPLIKGGQLRVLAVPTPQRLPVLPDTPTMAEAGFPDCESELWQAIYAPAGTPPDIIKRLNAEIDRIVHNPDMSSKLVEQGVTPRGGSPAYLAELQAREFAKWGNVIKRTGMKEG